MQHCRIIDVLGNIFDRLDQTFSLLVLVHIVTSSPNFVCGWLLV